MSELAITGIGMRSSVGQNAVQSCASVRAAINRFTEWTHFGATFGEDEVSIIGAAVTPDLGDRDWIGKFERLAVQPLMEALWMAGLSDNSPQGSRRRWKLYLAAPRLDRTGVQPEDAAEFLRELEEQAWLPYRADAVELLHTGHSAALMAVQRAAKDLTEGAADFCVVGGFDSFLQSEFLYELLTENQLKTALTPGGFIPGEAAAFVVLEDPRSARKRGAQCVAGVTGVKLGMESHGDDYDAPSTAEASSQVLRETLAELPIEPRRIQRVINDLNGERWRFLEWAMADARALAPLPPLWRLWHPADCLGEVGAATGAANLCIAARALQRDYAAGDGILVFTASETGERAATCVVKPNPSVGG